MWRQTAHAHLVALAVVASLCQCNVTGDAFNFPRAANTPIYLPHGVHTQSLSKPSYDYTIIQPPKAWYPGRHLLAVAGYVAISAVAFLLFSCFIVVRSFRETNARGSGRSLADEQRRDSCYDESDLDSNLLSAMDRRAIEGARLLLSALNLPSATMQDLRASERHAVFEARNTLSSHINRLAVLSKRISTTSTAHSHNLIAERDELRTLLRSFEWGTSLDIQTLLCRAKFYSFGRLVPHAVATAVSVAERVNTSSKPIVVTVTEEQQQVVKLMVKRMQEDMSSAEYSLVRDHSPPPPEVEAANGMLRESEHLCLQLRAAGMFDVLESLESTSSRLRGALGRLGSRRPRRTASLTSMFGNLSVGIRHEKASQASEGTQGLLRSSHSASSMYPGERRGTEGSASLKEQLGARSKTTADSDVSRFSFRIQRRGASKKESAHHEPTSPEGGLPGVADVVPPKQTTGPQELSSMTDAMQKWTTRCNFFFHAGGSPAAEDSLDGIATEGTKLYREASVVIVDPSVDPTCSKSFQDAVERLEKSLNALHAQRVGEWLGRVAGLRSKLTNARYNLQASLQELAPESPPKAGGPYVGDLCVLKSAVDEARRIAKGLSGFLGLPTTHHRISDALVSLECVLAKSESELQAAIGAAALAWRNALEEAEQSRQAASAARISSDTRDAEPPASSKSALRRSAKDTANVLKVLGGDSVDVQLLLDTLDRLHHGGKSSKRSSGIFRTLSLRRSGSSRASFARQSPPKGT